MLSARAFDAAVIPDCVKTVRAHGPGPKRRERERVSQSPVLPEANGDIFAVRAPLLNSES